MKMNLTTSEKNRGIVRFLLMSMLLCLLIHPAQAQDRVTVTGRLTDTSHAPLIGASVIEQGTTNGVTTDTEGNYQISVSGNATLGFSFIGYKPQSIAVLNRTVIDVTLEEDATMIGEVVAIGYGSQRKEDLSMAVTTVKLDEAAKSRASNLATILQGRMPGVTVQQTGDPMKPASFTIRGRGSKGNDDDPTSGDGVLVVVDGVPNAPYMMEDVETITVLKDAASAAIYGASVGSSGVILITTKKAQSGKLRVDVNVSLGFEKVTNLPKMLTAEQYNEVWAKTVEKNPGSQLPSASNPEVYPWGNVTRTDWLDEIFQTGFTQHYAATISGGSEKVQSIFSVSYDKKDGVLLNTYSESFNGKLQTDFKLTNWLKISERASFVVSNGQGNVDTSHQGPIMGAIWYPRAASVYEMNEDGTYARDEKGNRYYGGTSPEWADVNGTPMLYNPVAYLERMHRKYPEHKIFSTTSIEIKPISSLTIKSDFTIDLRNKESDEFYPTMTEKGLRRDINYREQFFDRDNHWLSETIATYAQVFGRHHISAMAGFTADFKRLHSREVYSRGYPDNDINSSIWDQANDWTSNTPKESKYEQTMVSFLARLGYSFDDRYFLVGSVRRDASSKLPASKNYDWFPSVSGSWKLSSEKFFRNAGLDKVFDLVKFRAGWGRIGNVDLYPNNVATVELLNYQYPIIFGQNLDQLLQGTYLNTIPNYSARWETTEQTSAGLDLTMFKNKLNISVDYYHKVTKDLIDYIPTPRTDRCGGSSHGQYGQRTEQRLGVLGELQRQCGTGQADLQRLGQLLDEQGLRTRIRGTPGRRDAHLAQPEQQPDPLLRRRATLVFVHGLPHGRHLPFAGRNQQVHLQEPRNRRGETADARREGRRPDLHRHQQRRRDQRRRQDLRRFLHPQEHLLVRRLAQLERLRLQLLLPGRDRQQGLQRPQADGHERPQRLRQPHFRRIQQLGLQPPGEQIPPPGPGNGQRYER